jgi:hypothetical protein
MKVSGLQQPTTELETFQVLTTTNMSIKTSVFSDVVPHSSVENDLRPADGGGKYLWNVGQYPPDYITPEKSNLQSTELFWSLNPDYAVWSMWQNVFYVSYRRQETWY